MRKSIIEVTCRTCGWVHFIYTRAHAEAEVAKFNAYFETLTSEDQESFGGRKSSISQYERCFCCGGSYKNFRPSLVEDAPTGVTLQPIIRQEE